MTRAAIVTRWTQTTDPQTLRVINVPAVFADVSPVSGDSWTDVTAQPSVNIPPRPNLLIVEVNVADATLTAVKANAQYGAQAVLWEGDPALAPVVTTAQYDQLVTWLANKFSATTTQVRNILGATSGGRTRYQ